MGICSKLCVTRASEVKAGCGLMCEVRSAFRLVEIVGQFTVASGGRPVLLCLISKCALIPISLSLTRPQVQRADVFKVT